MKMFSKKRKGFTLVELIIVMVILGALAAIAIPKMGGSTEGAELASIKSDMRMAIAEANMYYSKELTYNNVNSINKNGSTIGDLTNKIEFYGNNNDLEVLIYRQPNGVGTSSNCAGVTLFYSSSTGKYYDTPAKDNERDEPTLSCNSSSSSISSSPSIS